MHACSRVHHAARSNPNLEVLKLVIASETNGLADVRCPKVIRWAEALYDRNHDGALPLHLAATNANPDVFTFIAARRALGFETETEFREALQEQWLVEREERRELEAKQLKAEARRQRYEKQLNRKRSWGPVSQAEAAGGGAAGGAEGAAKRAHVDAETAAQDVAAIEAAKAAMAGAAKGGR